MFVLDGLSGSGFKRHLALVICLFRGIAIGNMKNVMFWSSEAEPWPNIVPQEAVVLKMFGSRSIDKYGPCLNLLEATMRTDDIGSSPFIKLMQHESVALVNVYIRKGFPFDSWDVKSSTVGGTPLGGSQAQRFKHANEFCV